jgi:hypothetical protein
MAGSPPASGFGLGPTAAAAPFPAAAFAWRTSNETVPDAGKSRGGCNDDEAKDLKRADVFQFFRWWSWVAYCSGPDWSENRVITDTS